MASITESKAELIADSQCATGESPVWLASEQALYWVNIPAKQLCKWDAVTQKTTLWQTPEMLACIAPHAAGGWIAGLESGVFHLLPQADGSLQSTRLCVAPHARPDMRFNDGRCDRQGRFVAGTMVLDMGLAASSAGVYSYEKNSNHRAELTLLLDGLIVPNGMAFSPDGRTMYLSDSHPTVQSIWTFDYDTDTGTPRNRRLFVDMTTLPGRPDGAAIDQDGCYWICGNDAGLIHRFTPEGRLDKSLAVPVKKPAMCAFGGPLLDTLYVTSIRPAGIDLSDQPLAGGVFALNPGTRGLPETPFSL